MLLFGDQADKEGTAMATTSQTTMQTCLPARKVTEHLKIQVYCRMWF